MTDWRDSLDRTGACKAVLREGTDRRLEVTVRRCDFETAGKIGLHLLDAGFEPIELLELLNTAQGVTLAPLLRVIARELRANADGNGAQVMQDMANAVERAAATLEQKRWIDAAREAFGSETLRRLFSGFDHIKKAVCLLTDLSEADFAAGKTNRDPITLEDLAELAPMLGAAFWGKAMPGGLLERTAHEEEERSDPPAGGSGIGPPSAPAMSGFPHSSPASTPSTASASYSVPKSETTPTNPAAASAERATPGAST